MMNDWILDVLADLKTFAHSNGLKALAEQLEDTALVAAVEFASQAEGLPGDAKFETREPEQDPGGLGAGF